MTLPNFGEFVRLALLLIAFSTTTAGAAVGSFPAKPIRLISPFAPGGGNDAISRALTQAMMKNIGQSVIVENRPGANTIVGMEVVAKALPDGYTLIMTSSSLVINPALYSKLPYDSERAFSPISLIASTPLIVAVHPSLPVKSISDLIRLAKTKPGELFYPVSGVGNISNLAGELFNILAGVKLISVSYKGAAPGLNDLLGGRLAVGFNSALATMQHVRTGRLRAVATTGSVRAAGMPDLPTVAESGLPGYEASTWYGVLAPAGTPEPIVRYLGLEIRKALNAEDVKDGLRAQGLDLVASTSEQFAAHIRAESIKWAKVIRATGMKAD